MAANTRMTTAGALSLAANAALTLDISSSLGVGGAFGSGTVSYTHLDVYKRQFFISFR